MRRERKDPDLKPPAGFRLSVGRKKIRCGATRLLELMSEDKEIVRDAMAAQNFPNRRVAPHPCFPTRREVRNLREVSVSGSSPFGSAGFDF